MRDRININEAYTVLGLEPGASQAQVKRAYRKLAKMWHPDRFVHPPQKQEAEEKIKLINEAYNQLKTYQPTSTNQSQKTQQKKQTTVYVHHSNAEIFYNWGVENAELKRYSEALSDFSHAIRINPNYIEAYKYRGFICSILGYEYRATSDLNKAAELEKKFKGKQGYASPSSRKSTYSRRKSQPKSLIGRFYQWIKSLFRCNRRFG
ncbi:MAG: DnaJ domain-containing protein [Scytonema sp. PMC 1069.18]|nr:DnaJ domain-containing protein [Scytonema sp. PMC 1069.18]MEC4880844.1 DnaJ domain-containing protein [Scytonema sp. PMC 1070.18]